MSLGNSISVNQGAVLSLPDGQFTAAAADTRMAAPQPADPQVAQINIIQTTDIKVPSGGATSTNQLKPWVS